MKRNGILLLLAIFLCGCSAKMTEQDLSKEHFVKATVEIEDKTPQERALAIKNRLSQIDGIIGTAVVVEGHTAIIGLRLEENMEQKKVDSVKKEAAIAAKGSDCAIRSTSVTENRYIVSLIEAEERKRAG